MISLIRKQPSRSNGFWRLAIHLIWPIDCDVGKISYISHDWLSSMSNFGWIRWTATWSISDQDQIMTCTFAVQTLSCGIQANHADHCQLKQVNRHLGVISMILHNHMADYCLSSIQRHHKKPGLIWLISHIWHLCVMLVKVGRLPRDCDLIMIR